jgi:hypothetical protein
MTSQQLHSVYLDDTATAPLLGWTWCNQAAPTHAAERQSEYQAIRQCMTQARQGMRATRAEIHDTFDLLREQCALGCLSERLCVRLADELQAARERFHRYLHTLHDARAAMQRHKASR